MNKSMAQNSCPWLVVGQIQLLRELTESAIVGAVAALREGRTAGRVGDANSSSIAGVQWRETIGC